MHGHVFLPPKLFINFLCLLLIREAIEEDEEGLLQPSLDEMVHRAKRKRILERKNLRLGMVIRIR